MKLSKLLSYTFFSLLLSSQVVAVDWKETPSIPVNKPFASAFNQVVIDDQGNATTLWEELDLTADPSQGRISAAVLKAGATKWQLTNTFPNYPTQSIGGIANSDSRQEATLVLSKEGIAACVFSYQLGKDNGHSYIASTFLKAESKVWETPKIINDITNFGGVQSGTASVAYDTNSRLYAVWTDRSTNQGKINFSQLENNGSVWTKPITISTGPTLNLNNFTPILAINPRQERIVAIWQAKVNKDDAISGLYGAYYTIKTGQWSTPELLTTPGFGLSTTPYQISQATRDSENYAVASFAEYNPDQLTKAVKYAILDSTGKWTPHLTLVKKSSITDNLAIAIDGDFQTTFLFQAADSDFVSKIFASTLPFNGRLSKPQQISGLNSASPKVAIDPSGKSIAIWTTTLANGNDAVFSAELPKSGKWTKPIKISHENRDQTAYKDLGLAVNILGTNIAVWTDKIPSTNTCTINGAIKTNHLPLPPTCIKGKQGKNKFLLQEQRNYFNQIKWCSSLSTTVVKYNVYRNGVLIGSVKASDKLSYLDDNILKGVDNVYSVRAVNKANETSQAVYITLP